MIRILWGKEDDSDNGKSEDDKSEDGTIVEEPTTRNMTAEEIEKMTARSADRASRKALKTLAEDFGFEGTGQMKDWVTSQREAETDALDDQEKATQDAERSKKEYDALKSDLTSDRLGIAVEKQVLAAQVSEPKKVSRIAALVRMDLDPDILNSESDWEEAITEALSSVKDDTPELFAVSKGFGSGDGGAQGDSTKDEDKEAAATKKLEDEFTSRGLIQYIP